MVAGRRGVFPYNNDILRHGSQISRHGKITYAASLCTNSVDRVKNLQQPSRKYRYILMRQPSVGFKTPPP